jgi:hypothetical protein
VTARFPFTDASADGDWCAFCEQAGKWKPEGYDEDMALRLRYYLDQQLDDTKAELKRRFPETHASMTPWALPITRHLVREQAKVFLASTKLELVADGEPITNADLLKWWAKTQEAMGLGLRLKRVDAYTTLMRTCGLRFGHTPGRLTAQVVFSHTIRVVMDPEAPMDLDRAHGVAIEVASEAGVRGSGPRRFEVWCAREGEEQHLVLEERSDEEHKTIRILSRDEGDPMRAPDGRTVVPLVLFSAHTEELGLFTLEGSDLIPANRGVNILVTDLHHIAEQQGFGVMVLETAAGGKTPGKIVRAPNTAISLDEGVTAKFINASAPIAELLALAESRIKLSAVLHGIPAGSVSIEARAVASGIALQIELRPLLEIRGDAVEVYRDPMRRVWEVFWAVHNAYAQAEGAKALPEDIEMRWTPGEIQMPVDDAQKVETILAKKKARLISRVEAIAQDRGVSLKEAKEIAKRIDEEEPPQTLEPLDDPLGLARRREQMRGAPPNDGREPDDEDEERPPKE